MTEKEKILKQLEAAKKTRGHSLNITLPAAMDYIRQKIGYDFFINDFVGKEKALYIRIYNKDGFFVDNKLWGFFQDFKIAEIFYNIINEK